MIGSFPIHVAGLIVVIAGILLFTIITIICSISYVLISNEQKQAKLWTGALLRSSFLFLALHILLSIPLMLLFGILYNVLARKYNFDFEKTKDSYDEYLLYVWTALTICIWFLTGINWRKKLGRQLSEQ